ncbi:hypothetical protein EMIHUDRAFT_451271, partial [Emiliania huxleyi CCMP1516]|uniref:Molybdate-anion transporter n=2 Tax=Emiliania huxleyi TaxID=2903 RepID=A0A0D3J5Y4_EMIH1
MSSAGHPEMPRHGPRHDSHHHRPGHHGGERHHNATRFAALADLPAAAPGGVLERLQQSFADEHLELAVLLGASLLCLAAWACLSFTAAVPASPCAQPISKAVSSERLVEPVVEGKPVPSSRGDTTVYRRLRNRYLVAYSLATFGDWIQGGYLYALYANHGYSMHQIAQLFAVGYSSAATLGTYTSAIGDVGGHRRNCVAYGILYAGSCLLANSPAGLPRSGRRHSYAGLALAASRLLGGISYSILFTSFESWLIAEAEACELPRGQLTHIFAASSCVYAFSAVVAGIVGHVVVELSPPSAEGGHNRFAAPFNVAAPVLLLASFLCQVQWSERYGDRRTTPSASLLRSWRAIVASRTLLALGVVNSLYETSLYAFVFMWTPSLERRAPHQISHGLIFSIFMVSKMAGAQGFALLDAYGVSPTSCLGGVFAGSALCLLVPVVSSSYEALLLAFSAFECLLGLYWPAIALVRAGELDD